MEVGALACRETPQDANIGAQALHLNANVVGTAMIRRASTLLARPYKELTMMTRVRQARFVVAANICAALALLGAARSAQALPPPVTVDFPLTGLELLPVGGEYLLATTAAGVITDAQVRLTFTANGTFQAENFVFELAGPTGGVGPLIGGNLGWAGQALFTTDLHVATLNGELQMVGDGPTLSYWFMNISQLAESLPTPVQGVLGDSFVRLTIQPCTVDWNGDFTRSVQDLFSFLTDYFGGSPYADLDGSGGVGVGDIFRFLQLYFVGCSGF